MNSENRNPKASFSGANPTRTIALVLAVCLAAGSGAAQVPGIISHQGKLTVNGTNFTGTGQFKFALVNAAGDTTWWSHDGTSGGGGEPSSLPIVLSVTRGVFSVNLGDTTVANMTQPIPPSAFTQDSVWLRVWVDDGVNSSQRLTPDRRITAAGYALVAGSALAPAETATNFSGLLAGDVTGPQNATVVSTVGGVTAAQVAAGANAANAATDANTPGTLVKRNANGDFAAGTITGRFVGDGSELTNLPAAPSAYVAPPGTILASLLAQDAALLTNPYRLVMTVPAPAWINGSSTDAPTARAGHSAIWAGQEMIIWGGTVGVGSYVASGAMYRPDSDSWTAMNSSGAPTARSGHTAIWSGNETIVWGGVESGGNLRTGGRFAPGTQRWTPVTPTGAPSERKGHQAVWTGSRMLVWGGVNSSGLLNDGALYDPVADQWAALVVPNPPAARLDATAVWAGDRFLVWGGTGGSGELNSGGQLIFSSGTPSLWEAMSSIDAPYARRGQSAIWTGDQMLVWGGQSRGTALGDGATFRPPFNTWAPLSSTNAPSARTDHAAVWTGLEMLIVDGADASGELSSSAAYDPVIEQWRALSNSGGPLARTQTAAVWTGVELMVFGGLSGGQLRVGSLQRLVPQPNWYFYRKL
ncbi:MAG: hypothetical protein HY674_09625 [Chloroflexi bacterium]|nr:hypothetical protein [Chloroflexota bacterium]